MLRSLLEKSCLLIFSTIRPALVQAPNLPLEADAKALIGPYIKANPFIHFSIAALLLASTFPAEALTFDLNGVWVAPFTVGVASMKMESVTIRQTGNIIQATKITGDEYVPAGKMNLRGTYSSDHFGATQLCAAPGFVDPTWQTVSVTILDADHFKVEGGCSGGAVWMRQYLGPKVS